MQKRTIVLILKKKRQEISIASLRKLQLSRGRRNGILQDIRRFVRSCGGRMALLLRKNGRDTN